MFLSYSLPANVRAVCACGFDPYSGYTLLLDGKVVAYLFNRDQGNLCPHYYVICENKNDVETLTKLFDSSKIPYETDNVSLINHLTGVKIPNDSIKINYTIIIRGLHFLRLSVSPDDSGQKKNVAKVRLSFAEAIASFVCHIRKCYKELKLAFNPKERDRLCFEQYESVVTSYLKTQDEITLDLRYGRFNDSAMSFDYNGTDDPEGWFIPMYRPITKEILTHVHSIRLALPGHSRSKFFQQLQNEIEDEKVFEAVVFCPVTLEHVKRYKHIKRLVLVEVETWIDLHEITSFSCLSSLFISFCEGVFSQEDLKWLTELYDTEFQVIKNYSIETVSIT